MFIVSSEIPGKFWPYKRPLGMLSPGNPIHAALKVYGICSLNTNE
jgi:hypothetical protein